ncbi:MAG: exosortase C-terminal domain/associated protein EpsI, partial [Thiogranum sp.]
RHFSAAVVVLSAGLLLGSINEREEFIPDRKSFAEFPRQISEWKGRTNRLESIYLDALKLDDYILADYVDDEGNIFGFYIAYYASQRSGETAHSPKSCLPGGGWRIESITQKNIPVNSPAGDAMRVNRVLIRQGEYTQLVYYWFQQRGRDITNEYLVKWYLFWDSMTKNRTDGALVRLVAQVPPGADVSLVEARMQDFIRSVAPYIDEYIPGADDPAQ